MKYHVVWDKLRIVGTVMNDEPSGMPYLGLVRRQDLLDGYMAVSTVYPQHMELGLFGGEQKATEAVVREAMNLGDRRATNRRIALAVTTPRIIGAGRAEVEAPADAMRYRKFSERTGARRKLGASIDLELSRDGEHACEADL
jgi:hypothetical protein